MNILKRFSRSRNSASLVILDDIFPHPLSAFRIAEYNAYLARYDQSFALSTATAFPAIGENRTLSAVNDEFTKLYPEFKDRVFAFESRMPASRLAYFMFVHNARHFLSVLNKSRTPFVFTLYPGFQLGDAHSDAALSMICASPYLRKIITTQRITFEYTKQFVDPEKIEFIYGGVFPSGRLTSAPPKRKYYKADKDTFDVCFVAFKYMPKAINKGYDVFIAVARLLSRVYADVRFHVIGPFDSSDISVSDLQDRIQFYGVRQTDFFPQFHANMDLILTPNVPFVLRAGAFDGFPTGASIEAGLCGVPVFCTDVLKQNIAFKDGKEILILNRDVDEICDAIGHYRSNYDQLVEMGRCGQQAFQRVFGLEKQLEKRFNILDSLLAVD